MYSGKKEVEKWIKDNAFCIHECVERGVMNNEELISSLRVVLKGKTKKIMIHKTTKLGTKVMINYLPTFYGRGHFSLVVYSPIRHMTHK